MRAEQMEEGPTCLARNVLPICGRLRLLSEQKKHDDSGEACPIFCVLSCLCPAFTCHFTFPPNTTLSFTEILCPSSLTQNPSFPGLTISSLNHGAGRDILFRREAAQPPLGRTQGRNRRDPHPDFHSRSLRARPRGTRSPEPDRRFSAYRVGWQNSSRALSGHCGCWRQERAARAWFASR